MAVDWDKFNQYLHTRYNDSVMQFYRAHQCPNCYDTVLKNISYRRESMLTMYIMNIMHFELNEPFVDMDYLGYRPSQSQIIKVSTPKTHSRGHHKSKRTQKAKQSQAPIPTYKAMSQSEMWTNELIPWYVYRNVRDYGNSGVPENLYINHKKETLEELQRIFNCPFEWQEGIIDYGKHDKMTHHWVQKRNWHVSEYWLD